MIPLSGHDLDCLVYLLSIFIILVSLKTGDLASKFGLDNGNCYLPPIGDV